MLLPQLKKEQTQKSQKAGKEDNQIIWSPDPLAFPMSYFKKGNYLLGTGLSLLGLVVSSLPLLKILEHPGRNLSMILAMTPFLVTGILILLYGIHLFLCRKTITMRQGELECHEIRVFITYHWKESIQKYQGVLKVLEYSERTGASKTKCKLLLLHKDPRKNVLLFQSYSWRKLHENWKWFSRVFNLPTLEKIEGKIALSPKPQDSKGNEVIWMDPQSLAFSSKVRIEISGAAYQIFNPLVRLAPEYFLKFIFSSLPLVPLFLFPVWQPYKPVAIPLGLLSLFYLLRAAHSLLSKEELYISPLGLEHWVHSPWGKQLKANFPAELITNIQVARSGKFRINPAPLVILTGAETVHFAHWLSEKDKLLLKDFLISVFSHCPSSTRAVA